MSFWTAHEAFTEVKITKFTNFNQNKTLFSLTTTEAGVSGFGGAALVAFLPPSKVHVAAGAAEQRESVVGEENQSDEARGPVQPGRPTCWGRASLRP